MLEISNIGVVTVFVAGLVSFLSPCVLPLVPGYISFFAGYSVGEFEDSNPRDRLSVFFLSLCFVAGFSTIFVIFGASATYVGQLLSSYRFEANIIGGVVIIFFGLFMTGAIKFSGLFRDIRFHTNSVSGSPIGVYVLGLAFAFGWTPCIGPILGSVLMISATTLSVGDGTALLAIYSTGLGVPFLIAALFTHQFVGYSKKIRGYTHILQFGAGVLLILTGTAMITGYLSDMAWWLLQVFPQLGEIG